jgi:uncharacterized membrane protein
MPPSALPPLAPRAHAQDWERALLLSKARRLRDASNALVHSRSSSPTTTANSEEARAYVANRVRRGGGPAEGGGGGVGGGQEEE